MDKNIGCIVKKEVYNEIDVAYPICVSSYEIRKIIDINKIYAILNLTKYTNALNVVKIKYQMISAFGEIVKESEQIIQNSTKSNILTVNLPLHNDTKDIKVYILECLMEDGTVIANKPTNIVTELATKIETKEELAVAKKIVPNAIVYSKEFSNLWYCACSALNLQNNEKCIACCVKKDTSLKNINKQKLSELIAKEQKEKAINTEKTYLSAINTFNNCKTIEDYESLISIFEKLGNYKESRKYIEKCKIKTETLKKKNKRRNLLIILSLVMFVGVIVFLSCLPSIIYNNNYKKIAKYIKAGDINSAYFLIDKIEDYNPLEVPSDYITEVKIANDVTTIKPELFKEFKNLKSITIPNTVTSIGNKAFWGCENLEKVNYIGTIDEWAQIKFDDKSNPLTHAKNLYINNKLVTKANITSATKINDYAFYGCESLKIVEIQYGVNSIGEYAFSSCSNLTSIEISNNVTTIGQGAFYDCPIVIAKVPTIAIKHISQPKLKTVVIKGGTSIGDYAFSSCSNLTSVTIGNSVTSIGDCAFMFCSSLTSITIPNSVTSIGSDAFYGCKGLTSIVIPNSVTRIGRWAFGGCDGLHNIYCRASSEPSTWSSDWKFGYYESVTWNYNGA